MQKRSNDENGNTKFEYPYPAVVALLRAVAWTISKSFWFIRFRGLENIPPLDAGGFLIASNHQTYIDPVWICIPIRHRMRFMAWDKAFEWKLLGPLIRYLGAFPVTSEIGGSLRAMKFALGALRDNAVLTVFPEGAREFEDGKFFRFKNGAVRIATQAGVPILPVTVRGANRIWPQGWKYPKLFRRVEISFHAIFDATVHAGKDADLDSLTAELEAIIATDATPLGP